MHSVAETLIQFLKALPEPVIPYAMYQRCGACANSPILSRQVRPRPAAAAAQLVAQLVADLAPAHHDLFVYIALFLKAVLQHSAQNKATAERLGLSSVHASHTVHPLQPCCSAAS